MTPEEIQAALLLGAQQDIYNRERDTILEAEPEQYRLGRKQFSLNL